MLGGGSRSPPRVVGNKMSQLRVVHLLAMRVCIFVTLISENMNRIQIFLMLFVCSCSMVSARAQLETQPSSNDFFQSTVTQSQPKMCKVFGAAAGNVEGFATGILVSNEGHLLTTQGVFLDGRQIKVILADGSEHSATVLRRDRTTQLALLKIQADTPNFFELATTDVGQQGDWVIGLTNAFKVADKDEPVSATLGVISLRTTMEARINRRDVAYDGPLVVIDAITSNPGAGGGAVVTTDGKLVGMVGKIINSSETNTRLNYAVPSSVLAKFVAGPSANANSGRATDETDSADSAQPGDLGIVVFTLGGRSNPAYIESVKRGSPAAGADLRADDLVISIAGEKIGSVKEYQRAIEALKAGEEVVLVLKRGNEFLRVPLVPVAK